MTKSRSPWHALQFKPFGGSLGEDHAPVETHFVLDLEHLNFLFLRLIATMTTARKFSPALCILLRALNIKALAAQY